MKILPTFVYDYGEYWKSIQRYNTWFIKLRWFAVVGLLVLTIVLRFIQGIQITKLQYFAFLAVDIFIALYNFLFYKINPNEVEQKVQSALGYSLFQMILDLISLSVLIYFTGGIESPLVLFFIFHMILGSLLLPAGIMYSMAFVLISALSALSYMEFIGYIPHQKNIYLYTYSFYKDILFIITALLTNAFVLIVSILLTNKIAVELYMRESQLKRALNDVHSAEESKQKFIMAVVHELKSPIAAASANLDLILSNILGEMNERIREKASRARFRLSESTKMINRILHVSQFRLLNQLHLEEIRLSGIISELLESSSSLLTKKQINAKFDDNENVPINADKVLIEIALSNLINNAIKYTEDNGKIEISVNDDDEIRHVSILDNGIGIPEDEIGRIFEEYYRATNVKKIEGTGTGLSLVKDIINIHNGAIKIKSPSQIGTHGRPGTEFLISLPIK